MRTGNKMLFCSPRIKIPAYHQLFAVLPWRCRFVLVQESLFAGCFFRFAPYGRALVGARCGYMPHKPLGTDQTAKCGKMWPIKRKQKAKCYFAFCALKSPLTTSCYPLIAFTICGSSIHKYTTVFGNALRSKGTKKRYTSNRCASA